MARKLKKLKQAKNAKVKAEVPHPSELPMWAVILVVALIAAIAPFFLTGGSLSG